MLQSDFRGCPFYVGDDVPRLPPADLSRGRQFLYQFKTILPQKQKLRGKIVNSVMGYIDRFSRYLDKFLDTRFLSRIESSISNPEKLDSIQSKMIDVGLKAAEFHPILDQTDTDMTNAVNDAWESEKSALGDLAVEAAALVKGSETTGVDRVNAEMNSVYTESERVLATNAKLISQTGAAQIREANKTAAGVVKLANSLWRGTNQTIRKADSQFKRLNGTLANLQQVQADMQTQMAQIEGNLTATANAKFTSVQRLAANSQLVASGTVDDTLAKMAKLITKALSALTSEEKKSLTSLSTVTGRQLQTISDKLTAFIADANRRATTMQKGYTTNITQTAQVTNVLLSNIDSNLQGTFNEVAKANASVASTQGYMDSAFAKLDTDVGQMFTNQSQTARLKKTALDSWMGKSLNDFKGFALNASRDGSNDLKQAFDAAMAAATTGSGALSMNFDQRKAVIASLQKWQSDYKGNTDKLVSTFSSTYTSLVGDTDSQMKGAIADQQANIAKAQAQQKKAIQDAVTAAHGDPAALQALIAQFGLVGDAAAAAAQNIQLNIKTSSGTMSQAQKDSMAALSALLQASSANSDAYKQAASMNARASSIASTAVSNVTNRLALMNSMMKQYSEQISASLFDVNNNITQSANTNSASQSATVAAAIQQKMASVQSMLANAISQGQTSSADISKFAASIGANATALQAIVDNMRSGSVSGLSDITQVSKDAIDGLKNQVAAQLASVDADFQSQLDSGTDSIAGLFDDMKSDLATQSGSKSALLLTKRDFLQQLFGELTSSGIERDAASKSLDKTFSDAESKVANTLPQLSAQVTQQQARVGDAIASQQTALRDASNNVNATIADTNATAQTDLANLQKSGADKIASVQKSFDDASGAVTMMVSRYGDVMQKYLDTDRAQRIQENSDEMAQIFKVQASVNASQANQASALALRRAASTARASALAGIVATLGGASSAAQSGQTAFMAYVKALADKSGVDMADLVAQMKLQVSNQTGALYDLLNKNGLFVSGTLDQLSQSAALIQQGVLSGTGDVLANVQSSLANANSLSAGQASTFAGLTKNNQDLQQITGDQLAALMTAILAQNALQQTSMTTAQQAAMSKTATVQDAMTLFGKALDSVTQADLDAMNSAAAITDDIDASTRALLKTSTDSALNAASTFASTAVSDDRNITQQFVDAGSMMSAFSDRVDQVESSFNQARPEIENQISTIKTQMQALESTVDQEQVATINKVNDWISTAEKSTWDLLTKLAVPTSF